MGKAQGEVWVDEMTMTNCSNRHESIAFTRLPKMKMKGPSFAGARAACRSPRPRVRVPRRCGKQACRVVSCRVVSCRVVSCRVVFYGRASFPFPQLCRKAISLLVCHIIWLFRLIFGDHKVSGGGGFDVVLKCVIHTPCNPPIFTTIHQACHLEWLPLVRRSESWRMTQSLR